MLNKSTIALAAATLSILTFSTIAAPAPATASQDLSFTKNYVSSCSINITGAPAINGDAIDLEIKGNDVTGDEKNSLQMTGFTTQTTGTLKAFNSTDVLVTADAGQTDTSMVLSQIKLFDTDEGSSKIKIGVATIADFVFKGAGIATTKITWLATCGVNPSV